MLFKIKGEKVHLCMVPHIIVINNPFGISFTYFVFSLDVALREVLLRRGFRSRVDVPISWTIFLVPQINNVIKTFKDARQKFYIEILKPELQMPPDSICWQNASDVRKSSDSNPSKQTFWKV